MILSDHDLRLAMQTGEINIAPFNEKQLRPASYRYTLAPNIEVPRYFGIIDLRQKPNLQYDSITMDLEKGYVIEPGGFILAQIVEAISLSNRVASFTDGRTTLARLGIEVVMSSMFVEPGQQMSHETLEIKNSGLNPVRLYPGMEIAKGIFFSLRSPSDQWYSQIGTYARQTSVEVQF